MALSLLTRTKYAIALVRANQFAGKKEYEKGIHVLERAFSVSGGRIEVPQLPLIVKVRYLSLCYKARRLEEALPVLKAAIVDLDRGRDPYMRATMSKADREYLYFYCRWLACLFPNGSAAFQIALTTGGSYETLDLPATSSLLKDTFPIPAEAGRYVDAFIQANMPSAGAHLA